MLINWYRHFSAHMATLAVAVLVFTCLPLTKAGATTEQERIIERSRLIIEDFLDDPNFQSMRPYVQNAFGVLIMPDMLKIGLLIGAEHGLGILMVRDVKSGRWGDPAFYDLYSGSLGLQFGGQSSDAVFTIMNPEAIDKLLTSRFRMGADASIAVGRVGAGIGAGTTVHFGEDIYVFSRNQGLYGGLAVDGALVVPRENWNTTYYGEPKRPRDIIYNSQNPLPSVEPLRRALGQF